MEPDVYDKFLQTAAKGGSLDYAIWPELLPRLIPMLERIVHTEFPLAGQSHGSALQTTPSLSPQMASQLEPASQSQTKTGQNTVGSSQSTDKESAPPLRLQNSSAHVEAVPGTLPPEILSLLNSVKETLITYFSQNPPHTIQRLSELILSPREHYRTLYSYLHAVDRVVHVTSGANIYPLPAAIQDPNALQNGTSNVDSISWGTRTLAVSTLGSDESLGGALLTPIPWLINKTDACNGNGSNHIKELGGEVKTESTETIDGPNGAGRIETVSVSVNGVPSATLASTVSGGLRAEGGVTQGELLRQEQRAGVVPANQLNRGPGEYDSDEDETPHARGPEEIGMEDMGPQAAGIVGHGMQGIDVEGAVGRRSEEQEAAMIEEASSTATPKREADEKIERATKRPKECDASKGDLLDKHERMVLVDEDGKAEGDA